MCSYDGTLLMPERLAESAVMSCTRDQRHCRCIYTSHWTYVLCSLVAHTAHKTVAKLFARQPCTHESARPQQEHSGNRLAQASAAVARQAAADRPQGPAGLPIALPEGREGRGVAGSGASTISSAAGFHFPVHTRQGAASPTVADAPCEGVRAAPWVTHRRCVRSVHHCVPRGRRHTGTQSPGARPAFILETK